MYIIIHDLSLYSNNAIIKIEIDERMFLKILINNNARDPEIISIKSLGLGRFNNIDGLTVANNHQDKDSFQ